MSYQGRLFTEDRRTKPAGCARHLPQWLIDRIKEREACYKRLEALSCYDHTRPVALPVGEFAWHEARKG